MFEKTCFISISNKRVPNFANNFKKFVRKYCNKKLIVSIAKAHSSNNISLCDIHNRKVLTKGLSLHLHKIVVQTNN